MTRSTDLLVNVLPPTSSLTPLSRLHRQNQDLYDEARDHVTESYVMMKAEVRAGAQSERQVHP
jgi:hypothetical protein